LALNKSFIGRDACPGKLRSNAYTCSRADIRSGNLGTCADQHHCSGGYRYYRPNSSCYNCCWPNRHYSSGSLNCFRQDCDFAA
jgi:hypothetical protein